MFPSNKYCDNFLVKAVVCLCIMPSFLFSVILTFDAVCALEKCYFCHIVGFNNGPPAWGLGEVLTTPLHKIPIS